MLARVSILAVLAVGAAAQNFTVAGFFNLSAVDSSNRTAWCTAQKTVCSTLCSGDTANNTCINQNLDFGCTCAANNSAPGLAFYQNTIPWFECENAFSNCIAAHPNDLTGQTACKTDIEDTCGSIDSTNMTFGSSTSSSAAASATATSTSSGSGSSSGSSSTASTTPSSTANAAAAMVVDAGQHIGLGALAAAVFASFGFLL